MNTSQFYTAGLPAPTGNGGAPPGFREANSPGQAQNLRELLQLLRRRWRLVLAVTLTLLGVSAYLTFSTPPLYEAEAVIRLADVRRAFTGGFDDYATEEPLGRTTNPITSELEVLRGRAVLGEVVDRERLRLVVNPRSRLPYKLLADIRIPVDGPERELTLQFQRNTFAVQSDAGSGMVPYGQPARMGGLGFAVTSRPPVKEAKISVVSREAAIDLLTTSLRVLPRGNTNAVSVRYSASDPFYAQKVVNAAVSVFRDVNARSARQQAQRRREFLEGQLSKNDVRLAAAEQAFGAFQAREQVYSAQTRSSAQEQDLLALEMRREELRAERRTYASLLALLGRTPAAGREQVLFTLVSLPALASNSIIVHLYGQRSAYEQKIDSLTAGAFGSTFANPDVQRLRSLSAATESRLLEAVRGHVAAVEARIAALDSLRSRSALQMLRLPATQAEELRLRQQLETIGRVGDKLASELQDARMAEAVEMGQVEIVYFAPLPMTVAGGGHGRMLAVGLALGLLFGCVGAFARDILSTSIRRRDELEETLRLPELALVPPLTRRHGVLRRMHGRVWRSNGRGNGAPSGSHGRPLIAADAEAYRMLRSSVAFAQPQTPLRRLAVTSAVAGEGTTTTAANLAIAFAEQGRWVVLVDCNLRAPRLHELFGVRHALGLTDVLRGDEALGQATQPTAHAQLFVLAAGSDAGKARYAINEGRLAAVLDELCQSFDLVIIDSPPVLESADAMVVGRVADGGILVVRAGETERSLAREARQQLTLAGARLLGAVLNDPAGKAEDDVGGDRRVPAGPRARR